MATLAGIEAHLSPSGQCRMGLVWEKQWKWNKVTDKAANFTKVQWARLQFCCSMAGRVDNFSAVQQVWLKVG